MEKNCFSPFWSIWSVSIMCKFVVANSFFCHCCMPGTFRGCANTMSKLFATNLWMSFIHLDMIRPLSLVYVYEWLCPMLSPADHVQMYDWSHHDITCKNVSWFLFEFAFTRILESTMAMLFSLLFKMDFKHIIPFDLFVSFASNEISRFFKWKFYFWFLSLSVLLPDFFVSWG